MRGVRVLNLLLSCVFIKIRFFNKKINYFANKLKSFQTELDNRPIPGTVIFENNMGRLWI
jgi:hypothetical protein